MDKHFIRDTLFRAMESEENVESAYGELHHLLDQARKCLTNPEFQRERSAVLDAHEAAVTKTRADFEQEKKSAAEQNLSREEDNKAASDAFGRQDEALRGARTEMEVAINRLIDKYG